MKNFFSAFCIFAAAAALAIAGCTKDDGASGGGVDNSQELASLREQIAQLEKTVSSLEQTKSALENEKAALEREKAEIEKELEDAKSSQNQQIAQLEQKLAAIEQRISTTEDATGALTASITGMSTQIESMQNAVNGKVDKSEYDRFVQQTNDAIQENLALLAKLEVLCAGFGEGENIKSYIDSAVESLTSSLGNYVLKSVYESFYQEFKTFEEKYETDKSSIEAQIRELAALIEALDPDTGNDSSIGDLTQLQLRLAELEAKAVSMEDVYSKFSAECLQFNNGVNGVIDAALAEGGKISAAIEQTVKSLLGDFASEVDQLKSIVDDLAGRVGSLEEQMADIIGRIQSLVYVPKTSDGMIHIGSTYIAANDDDENRIEVASTKKIEYRVSPAELSAQLVKLPVTAFSFWQEHVTRAEQPSMDEFHVVKVEEGNGPGEILITVNNEHDFTFQNLAVALCVKSESASGVKTEFTSPYTTVIKDGRNIFGRFYLARNTASGYERVYDDELVNIVKYDDATTGTLFGTDYEVVYDNGEEIMSLNDAKERFEWEVDIKWTKTGVAGAFVNELSNITTVPAAPNSDRSKPVTFTMSSSSDRSNIGKKLSDKYRIDLISGNVTVTLKPQFGATVLACDTKYTVEGTHTVVWQYGKWEAATGRLVGDYSPYITEPGEVTGTGIDDMPESVVKAMFSSSNEWVAVKKDDSGINGELTVRSTTPVRDGGKWKTGFSLLGYKYSEGTESLQSLTCAARPAHMIGNGTIELSVSNFTFDGLPSKTIDLTRTIKQSSVATPLFYVVVSDKIKDETRKLPYTDEEVNKYFGGSSTTSPEFMHDFSLNFSEWSNDIYTMPMSIMLTRSDEDSMQVLSTIMANTGKISPALEQTTQFTAPENAELIIKDGPTFKITGTITVEKD